MFECSPHISSYSGYELLMKLQSKPEFMILMQMLKPEYLQGFVLELDSPEISLGFKLQQIILISIKKIIDCFEKREVLSLADDF